MAAPSLSAGVTTPEKRPAECYTAWGPAAAGPLTDTRVATECGVPCGAFSRGPHSG